MMHPSLRSLLRRAFSAEELRRFIADLPSFNEEIRAQLPAVGASLDTLIDVVLEVFERRNLLDRVFFARIASARPNHAAELSAVAQERGLSPIDTLEIASLLSDQRDAAVERKLTELERTFAVTPADRLELNLAVADLNWWRQEANASPEQSSSRRDAIVRRLTMLASALAERGPRKISTTKPPHPEALELRTAIESHIRRADGERAVLRLLDLAERFAPDKATHRAAIMLSAQIQTWRAAHKNGSKPDPNERHEWVRLLQAIVELTDQLVESSVIPTPEATGSYTMGDAQITQPLSFRLPEDSAERGALVSCSSLSKHYGKKGRFALRDVCLTVFPRTVVGVIGPNGAGKTTLLRILSGEVQNSSGKISYPQLNPAGGGPHPIDWPTVRSRIAYLPQRLPIWRGQLADNLHAWATACGIFGRENQDTVEFYLERLGLTHYRRATWREISGGYQTRFALAKALVGRPRLLILDEPLAPLDVRAQQRFLQDIRDIISSSSLQQSVILSSQHIPEVEAIADELLGLSDDGSVWFHGSVSDLEKDRTQSIYELGGHLAEPSLDRLSARFGPGAVQHHETFVLLRVDREISRAEILDILVADRSPPPYIRDISTSLTRMFWRDET